MSKLAFWRIERQHPSQQCQEHQAYKRETEMFSGEFKTGMLGTAHDALSALRLLLSVQEEVYSPIGASGSRREPPQVELAHSNGHHHRSTRNQNNDRSLVLHVSSAEIASFFPSSAAFIPTFTAPHGQDAIKGDKRGTNPGGAQIPMHRLQSIAYNHTIAFADGSIVAVT
ncbi:hypothetical protein BJX76DRAFT_361545 [Aspergillus varians]